MKQICLGSLFFMFLKSGCNKIHITDLALSGKALMIIILSFVVWNVKAWLWFGLL